MSSLTDLKAHLARIESLSQAQGLLNWDQHTYMPPGGAEGRSEQLGVLSAIVHDLSTSVDLARAIDGSESEVAGLDQQSIDYQIVRRARYDYDLSTKLPTDLVAEITKTNSLAEHFWAEARKEGNFAKFAPWLKKNVGLTKQLIDLYGYDDKPYDAVLNLYEPKMLTRDVQALFDQVRPEVVHLVKAVTEAPNPVDATVLTRTFDESAQEQFGKLVAGKFGYDFNRGRLDRTVHPFASSFGKGDCRITTRYDANFVQMALMGTMHEAGHAMYEQNIGDDLVGTNLASGCSNSLHESQSRMWENMVGRGRPFWEYFFFTFQSLFPEPLAGVDAETMYRALNKIEPSLIRVEADEVTYNLHIILRFELEQDLIEDKLSVDDAPAAWNAKMQEYLGITPPSDSEGVLQDVHWAMGGIGYFPTYSLGNFLSAQLFETALKASPEIPDQIAQGNFSTLFNWVQENVWTDGRRRFPQEQITKATGRPLETGPYLRYLKNKFGDIYGL